MKNHVDKKLEKTISQANHFFVNQRYHQALPLYQQAIKIAPKDHHIWSNLASTLMQLGQLEEAKNHFEIALNLYPKNPAALNNLAALLGRLGKKKEALETLENLHQLTPNDPEVLSNIGVALNRLDRQQEALLWFDKALALAPTFSDAHHGKASAAAHLGQEKTAQFHCQQAIQYKSHAPSPRLLNMMLSLPVVAVNKQQAQQTVETFTQNIFSLKNWVEQDSFYLEELGNIVGDRQPFALAYRLGNICEPLSLYGDIIAWAAKAYWEKRNLFPIPKPEKREKIRLAILSEQIRRHSVWDIILKGIVKHLNRQYFEIFLYHTGMHIDEETKWAESVVDKFIQGPKGHTEWLIQIRQDTPDVIFFPEIGMDTLTCKLAALRLAPLQVASWGHPVTTGLPEIDLYFSGELIEGEQAATHYREKLIKLPGTGACTEPLPNPALPIPREQLSIPEDRTWVRMVICQRPFKLDPAFDDMLAQTVKASWPCKLFILKDMQLPWATQRGIERLTSALLRHDVDATQCLVEVPWLGREHFFGLLDEMDIYLDMPAFSGYTTAWQAVHRGMPIVTLEGEFMRQRLAAGLLRKIEQTETIAQSEAEYIDIATRLAEECRDAELRAKRRAAIKAAAPKADHDVSVVRAFEKTLIDELAARGRTFDFAEQPSEMTIEPTDSVAATRESSMMNNETNQTVYPWQLLNGELHLHTLTPNYAPTGLLEMIAAPENGDAHLKVLDVGCFCGGSGRWIKQKFPGAEVIGIEMLPKAAEVAAPDYDKVIVSTFENVDFEAEGLKHGSVDAIIAADVLEHLYNPWQALQRLKPLLAPGGAIYISLPNVRNLNILNALAKGEWQYAGAGILDVTHIRFFTKKQALEMLEQTGWQATEIRINPDPRLVPAFEGKDLSQIQNIELDNLKLTGLSQEDVLELLALQLFIRAEPK